VSRDGAPPGGTPADHGSSRSISASGTPPSLNIAPTAPNPGQGGKGRRLVGGDRPQAAGRGGQPDGLGLRCAVCNHSVVYGVQSCCHNSRAIGMMAEAVRCKNYCLCGCGAALGPAPRETWACAGARMRRYQEARQSLVDREARRAAEATRMTRRRRPWVGISPAAPGARTSCRARAEFAARRRCSAARTAEGCGFSSSAGPAPRRTGEGGAPGASCACRPPQTRRDATQRLAGTARGTTSGAP
jgi:hypothetical protein